MDNFKLSAADAGARTAGFVLLATLMRPVGGMLADRLGGARVLVPVFIAVAVLGALMGCPGCRRYSGSTRCGSGVGPW